MRVLIVNPGERPQVADIATGLASLQGVGGGDIELWAIDGHARFLCNDEGRILGMPFNRFVTLRDGTVWDLYGPILVVGGDEDTGDGEFVTDADIAYWQPRLDVARARVVCGMAMDIAWAFRWPALPGGEPIGVSPHRAGRPQRLSSPSVNQGVFRRCFIRPPAPPGRAEAERSALYMVYDFDDDWVTLNGTLHTADLPALQACIARQFFSPEHPTCDGAAELSWNPRADGAVFLFLRGREPDDLASQARDIPWARAWLAACPDLTGHLTIEWPYREIQETEGYPIECRFEDGQIVRTDYFLRPAVQPTCRMTAAGVLPPPAATDRSPHCP